MIVGSGNHTYEWSDSWAKIPNPESAAAGWSHHGVVVTESGNIMTLHQGDLTMLVFDRDGNAMRSWSLGLNEAHGMTLVKEGGTEYLWITDNGRKRLPSAEYEYPMSNNGPITGQAVKTTLEGETVMRLRKPPLPIYEDGDYMPTWVAVNEERNGGNGDIWVTDGYAQNHVHRYDKAGSYINSINGKEGEVGAFNCPHAIFIDTRKTEPELYVADRGNGRVQVYDVEGKFKRGFGSDFLTSPSGFATDGEILVVAELRARVTLLDIDDRPVAYLGANEQVCDDPGWPNNEDENGNKVRPRVLEQGKFNSPHGMAVDASGNVYIAEWLIGGRFIKLAKH